MSTANIAAFQDKVATSADLQARLAEIQSQAARSTAEAIACLATEIGTPFTAEDLLATAPTTAEIPDQDLADVAGGAIIVKKERAADNFGNLWGLAGKNYNYTTDDGEVHPSGFEYKVGEPYVTRRRVVQ